MPSLPLPPKQYSQTDERARNQIIEIALDERLERFQDIETSVNRIILTSPNGTRYELIVDDAGALSTRVPERTDF
jgi:hypothetical protein